MANVTLKVSKSAYQDKIARLEGLKNELDQRVTDYEAARNSMTKFIGEGDDNYNALRENVQTNINTCRKASEMCAASIESLRTTLEQMEDFGSNVSNLVNAAAEEAVTKVKTAIDIANLVN